MQEAAAELAQYEVLLLLDVRRPVAGFGYKWVGNVTLCLVSGVLKTAEVTTVFRRGVLIVWWQCICY